MYISRYDTQQSANASIFFFFSSSFLFFLSLSFFSFLFQSQGFFLLPCILTQNRTMVIPSISYSTHSFYIHRYICLSNMQKKREEKESISIERTNRKRRRRRSRRVRSMLFSSVRYFLMNKYRTDSIR